MLVDSLPKSASDHFKIIDCGMKSFPDRSAQPRTLTAMRSA